MHAGGTSQLEVPSCAGQTADAAKELSKSINVVLITFVKLFVFVGILIVGCTDNLRDEIAGLSINLPQGRELSSKEVRQVLRLAHDAGLRRANGIGVMGSQSGDFLLHVTGEEITNGRRVSREEVIIRQPAKNPTTGKASGEFSRYDAPLHNREWVIFTINGKELRLECPRETDIAEADKVFAAFAAGRVDYETNDIRGKAEAMQINLPQWIGIREGRISIGFPNGDRWCFDFIRGRMRGEQFVIEDAGTGCA